jgi:RHS repeat-associated protein
VSAEVMMKFTTGTRGGHLYTAYQDANGQNEIGSASHVYDLAAHQQINEWSRIYRPQHVVPAGKYKLIVYLRVSQSSGQSPSWFDDFKISVKRGYTEQVLSAEVLSANSYYAFGSLMPKRSFNSVGYRYGFNGKELDPEGMGGGGATYDYGFRIYNPALGRFLSVDPLFQSFPWYTPYQFAGNKPIVAIDLDGLEERIVISTYDQDWNETQTIVTDRKIIQQVYDYYNKHKKEIESGGDQYFSEGMAPETGELFIDRNGNTGGLRLFYVSNKLDDASGSNRERGWVPEGKGSTGDGVIGKNPAYIDAVIMMVLGKILGGPGYKKPDSPKDANKEVSDRIEQIKEYASEKKYPSPSTYEETSHDGGSGGNYIKEDSSLYEKRLYNKENSKIPISVDTIDTSIEKMP